MKSSIRYSIFSLLSKDICKSNPKYGVDLNLDVLSQTLDKYAWKLKSLMQYLLFKQSILFGIKFAKVNT